MSKYIDRTSKNIEINLRQQLIKLWNTTTMLYALTSIIYSSPTACCLLTGVGNICGFSVERRLFNPFRGINKQMRQYACLNSHQRALNALSFILICTSIYVMAYLKRKCDMISRQRKISTLNERQRLAKQ